MTTPPKNTPPDCFGNIEKVFPLGDDGLRHTPAPCLECADKTECLRAGLKSKAGLKIHEDRIDKSYQSGLISFAERWSKKKAIHRRKRSKRTSIFNWRLFRRKAAKDQR